MKVTDEMVVRFLAWKVPADFMPDCGVSFTAVHPTSWPTGTNLLNADQARAMLEHVLATQVNEENKAEPVKEENSTHSVEDRLYSVLRELADAERAHVDPVDAMVKARARVRGILDSQTVTPEAIGDFVDGICHKVNRNPRKVARRALEEMVEVCLAAGCSAQEVWGGVADAIHNQTLKLSERSGRTYFPSQMHGFTTFMLPTEEVKKEIADVRLVLLDLMWVLDISEEDVLRHMNSKYAKLTAPGVEFITDGNTFYMKKPHIKDCPST